MPITQKQLPSAKSSERQINVPLPFRAPVAVPLLIEVHKKWQKMVREAEILIADDVDLQNKVAKGLRMKGRRLPPEVLGRLYAQYCTLINKMYEAYLCNLQLQRTQYIQEIITVLMKRMYELRNEIVHVIVNDYIYVDGALQQLMKCPVDIQIVVPYHYAVEARPDTVEQLLQKMWTEAIKRKKIMSKKKSKENAQSEAKFASQILGEDEDDMFADVPATAPDGTEVEDEMELSSEESEHTIISEDYTQALLIQRHERFRKFFVISFLEKAVHRRTYFASKKAVRAPRLVRIKAARLIQKVYRRYMEIKRQRILEHKRDVLLGLLPDEERKPLKFVEERNKLYEKRRLNRQKIDLRFKEQIEKEKLKLLFMNKDEQIEDITQDILVWFFEWYYGYGFFPQYPYELEGGTLLVARGEYQTVEEQQEADEKYKAATKGKTKDQLKEEKAQAKQDAILKAEIEEEKRKKEKLALFKARCNPATDPGYQARVSGCTNDILEALRRYRQAWSIYDEFPLDRCVDVIYGYMNSIIREDIMNDLHIECRKYVDELMRLELKLFNKAQQEMYRRVEWKWPKQRPRKRPKPLPEPKLFNVDDAMLESVEQIFDMDITSKPTTKIDDVFGDISCRAYEANVDDPWAKFPSPGYGDVKRRLVLSCVLGSGIEPGADRKKSVLLLGIPRNGKTFLADAVAGELGAVKFDISPEVFSAVTKKPGKALGLVFTAARIFQPSVIFCKNIERVFYKTVPANEKKQKARAIKSPLTKLLKTIPANEKIIFIATCSNPWVAKVRPMMRLFSEVILVPQPDYGTIQRFFYEKLQSIRSMPRDYCVQSLAQTLQGLGFGALIDLFEKVLNSERICRLNVTPLHPMEFLEYMIENGIEPITAQDYQKLMDLCLQYSPLKAEREEYYLINKTRAYCYEKLEKKKKEDEAKKAAGKKK